MRNGIRKRYKVIFKRVGVDQFFFRKFLFSFFSFTLTVRQQEHQPALLVPPFLGRGHEQVHHRLRVVGQVSELGLPQDQCPAGSAEREAVLERERRALVERGVPDLDALLPRAPPFGRRAHPGALDRAEKSRRRRRRRRRV